MQPRAELGAFLRSRRDRIRPEDVGYASGAGARRVPGLRREELAHLAGVSVDYYVRLEQGRNHSASDAVLNAVADALRLDADERAHLFRLARPPRPGPGPSSGRPPPLPPLPAVRPGVQQLLDAIDSPALALGHRMDVLAWNRLACALITDFARLPPDHRNLARLHLTDPEIGARYPERDFIAREVVGHLRLAAGQHPDDSELSRLIAELTVESAEFRHHWALHTVKTKSYGRKRINHPVAGPLSLSFELTTFPQDPDLALLAYTAAPDSREAEALRLLASWGSSEAAR
ncbi:helix-turn-helix domain-containing protein [Streptomyces sp. A7024]|uniref:Helix-turn-helix domain-containing protein n=1 Tax=Streptomyces coryli TaxID=1128680 RepID=A0A6G4UF20_9ACTN|nr:helix-turn-helix transcriptional regulator [Streptomyces coryli]NGN70391.1 helix-turn-helix domain-containing protein [Streptomyces coryli]